MDNDATYLAIILGLFVLMFLLVKACDLIIGSDEAAFEDHGSAPGPRADTGDGDQAVAA